MSDSYFMRHHADFEDDNLSEGLSYVLSIFADNKSVESTEPSGIGMC